MKKRVCKKKIGYIRELSRLQAKKIMSAAFTNKDWSKADIIGKRITKQLNQLYKD